MKYKLRYLLVILAIPLVLFSSCQKVVHPVYKEESINVSINGIKGLYEFKGEDIKIDKDDEYKNVILSGVVISNDETGNNPIDNGFIVQEGSTGIGILVEGEMPPISVRDSVLINIESGTISSLNGNIIIKGITSSDISNYYGGEQFTPKSVVIGDLVNNTSKYLGTLVKIQGAQVMDYVQDIVFEGNRTLNDGTEGSIELHTNTSASFKRDTLSKYGTFTGIIMRGPHSSIQLYMRDTSDYEQFTPSPYPVGFPEIFDTKKVKDHYAKATVQLNSGPWTFDRVTIVTITSSRHIDPDGTKGIQFDRLDTYPDMYLQMDFDVYKGASKVTILYAPYGSDDGCKWDLEYSTDGGNSWQQIGNTITVQKGQAAKTAEFDMNIKGKVRFRVHKFFLSPSEHGRMNMDNFTIYNN